MAAGKRVAPRRQVYTYLLPAKQRQDSPAACAVEPLVLRFVRHDDADAARRARQVTRAIVAERDESRAVFESSFAALDDAAQARRRNLFRAWQRVVQD